MTPKLLRVVALVLALLAPAPALAGPAPTPGPPVDAARVRDLVERLARANGAKAVLFGLWQGEREVLTLALGDSMTTVPATTAMHFRIGGIGETFMSTLLLKLVEHGRLRLDDRIDRWFPGLLAADRVTVRMLVSNTAGYPDYVRVQDLIDRQLADPFRSFSDDELIAYAVRGGRMAFPPGTSQAYSHTDNVILGQVIQRATGRSIKALYEELLSTPLGLADTRFPSDQQIQSPVLHAFSSDRGLYEESTFWSPSWGSTPALPTSNLHDLGRWARILGTGQLLRPDSFQLQIAPSSVGKGHNRPDHYFAYGFMMVNGWMAQNPSINGYSGAFGYHRASGLAVVVAATKGGKASPDGIAFTILRAVSRELTPAAPINF